METNDCYRIVGEAVPVVEPEAHFVTGMCLVGEESEVANETVTVSESTIEPLPMLNGAVAKCAMLNIRSAPSKDADIVAVIPAGTEVMVDPEDFGEDWYSVWIATGVHGFCMKDYITIQQ